MKNTIPIILLIIGFAIFATLITMTIYCWTTFGGKSVQEIPMWALFFMWGK